MPNKPWYHFSYLLLLPVFFVVHSLNQFNMGWPDGSVWLLLGYYLAATIVLSGLFLFLYKNRAKAAIGVLLTMSFFFFFGVLQDFLKKHAAESFLLRYSFLLPLLCIVLAALLFLINRSRWNLYKAGDFLNLLFIVLILLDITQMVIKENRSKPPGAATLEQLKQCSTCEKPDIYLIVADEYAGYQQLMDQFGFDNSAFESELGKRGFRVIKNSRSNYRFTMHSIASMLNFNYLEEINGKYFSHEENFPSRKWIRENAFVSYLQGMNYTVHNLSFFDLEDHPKPVYNYFFLSPDRFINRQTLTGRMNFDMGFHLASAKKIEEIRMHDHQNNETSMRLLKEISGKPSGTPRFVYSHLSLPHHPYYFDRNGNPMQPALNKPEDFKKPYIEYLLYSNKKLLQLIDTILQASKAPPVIILMGDHGFRQFTDKASWPYHFVNLNAVLIPGNNYNGFYDGMTNVNQMRVLVNTLYGQQLPMLRDSTIFTME